MSPSNSDLRARRHFSRLAEQISKLSEAEQKVELAKLDPVTRDEVVRRLEKTPPSEGSGDAIDLNVHSTTQTEIPQTSKDVNGSVAVHNYDLRFQLGEPCGAGGIGELFSATDTQLKRTVVVKKLKQKFCQLTVSRDQFQLEAEITGFLQHPFIPPVYAFWVDAAGRPGFAMKMIHGETLQAAIDRVHQQAPTRRSRELRSLLEHLRNVCGAVAYAHSKGVIHRDLKPKNIMIDRDGETMVMDWGIAKIRGLHNGNANSNTASEFSTSIGLHRLRNVEADQPIGTPAYMSPEQSTGDRGQVDERSDVYALGAMLHTILTGRPPTRIVQPDDPVDESHSTSNQTGEPRRNIPDALWAITNKAMQKIPDERYQNAEHLRNELQAFLADEGDKITAWNEPVFERVTRMSRQYPRTFTALLASIPFIITIAIAVSVLINIDANRRLLNQRLVNQKVLRLNEMAKRGAWSQLVKQIQQTPLDDVPEQTRIELEFLQLRALNALQKIAPARDLLKKMKEQPESDEFAGRLALWDVELNTPSLSNSERQTIIADALPKLVSAEKNYATSLVADSTAKAISELRKALAIDATHQRARARLAFLEYTLGRADEAIFHASLGSQLSAADPRFAAIIAMAKLSSGEDAQDEFEQLERLMPKQEFERLRTGILGLEETRSQIDRYMGNWSNISGFKATRVFLRALNILGQYRRLGTAESEELYLDISEFPAGIAWIDVLKGLANPLNIRSKKRLTAVFEEAYKKHPDGAFQFLKGISLLNPKDSDWDGAIKAFTLAAKSDSINKNVRREAHYCLAMSKAGLYIEDRTKTRLLVEAAGDMRKRLEYDTPIAPNLLSSFLSAGVGAPVDEFYDVAAGIILINRSAHPDDPKWLRWELKLHQKQQNYGAAISVLDRLIELNPDNDKLKKQKQEFVAKFVKQQNIKVDSRQPAREKNEGG